MVQVNIKPQDNLAEDQLKKLIEGLKKIDGFEFFVVSSFMIK